MPKPERALISEILRMAGSPKQVRFIRAGIGDDCAVLRLSSADEILVTTDFSMEGVHFRRDWHPPEAVGHRCLTRGLSDIAAMGGQPVAAFLSLALPSDLPDSWVRHFMHGLLALARKYKVTLAGGDTAQSPAGVLADIVVLGSVPKGKSILRSGAKPGHLIYVSGTLGGSAAAIHAFREQSPQSSLAFGSSSKVRPTSWISGARPNARTYPGHFYPEPRLKLSRILREKNLASAMIDLSDGLSTDLSHICEESRVGAEIFSPRIPLAVVGKPAREVSLDLALNGGEDYELIFTAPRTKRIPQRLAGVRITQIGEITRSKQLLLLTNSGSRKPLHPRGWEHFRKSSEPVGKQSR